MKGRALYTATVSAKGQITLPKEIRRILSVLQGDRVQFIVDGSKITIDKEIETCPMCKGDKTLDSRPCFCCEEKGTFSRSFSFYSELSKLSRYKIRYSSTDIEILEGENVQRTFPVIQLISDYYSQSVIDKYHDLLQAKAIDEVADENYLRIDDVIQYFKTDEVRGWIRKKEEPLEELVPVIIDFAWFVPEK